MQRSNFNCNRFVFVSGTRSNSIQEISASCSLHSGKGGSVAKKEVCKAIACFFFQDFNIPPLNKICGASLFRDDDKKSGFTLDGVSGSGSGLFRTLIYSLNGIRTL